MRLRPPVQIVHCRVDMQLTDVNACCAGMVQVALQAAQPAAEDARQVHRGKPGHHLQVGLMRADGSPERSNQLVRPPGDVDAVALILMPLS